MNSYYRVDAKRLYNYLRIKGNRIPKDMEGTYHHVPLFRSNGKPIALFDVIVFAATGAYAKHRIYVRCRMCGLPIPFGRLHQHVDSRRCVENRPIVKASDLNIDMSKNVRLIHVQDISELADAILGKKE